LGAWRFMSCRAPQLFLSEFRAADPHTM